MPRRVTPKSRSAWRSWLDRHHDSCDAAVVVFYKRHARKSTLTYDDAVEEAICFGWIDGIKRSIDDDRYSHRFTPRKPNSKWSATNRKRAERMILSGRMMAAGSEAIRQAKRTGAWQPEAESIDLTVPSELANRLEKNSRAAEFFESLAPSYRNHFIAWINVAKRAETRQRRIDEAVELLARGEKLGMR